jgi:hypothetical protein
VCGHYVEDRTMPKPHLPSDIERATPGVPNELVDEAPEEEVSADPTDYSAIGGPESEPAYGRSRSVAGEYPFNEHGGPHDRDEPSHVERGGIQTRHRIEKQT